MRLLFVVFLLFAFYGTARVYGQEAIRMPMVVAPCVNCVPAVPLVQPAPMIYVPQVQVVPYQYQGSAVLPRDYHTPLRNWFFGRYRTTHYYSPQVQR